MSVDLIETKHTGRPSELTTDVLIDLERAFKKTINLKTAVEELGLNYKTVEGWITRDYNGLRTAYKTWKIEKALDKSEEFSNELMSTPHLDEEGNPDKDLMRMKQNESQFLRETVGKHTYSKRSESVNFNLNTKVDKLPPEDKEKLIKLLNGESQGT